MKRALLFSLVVFTAQPAFVWSASQACPDADDILEVDVKSLVASIHRMQRLRNEKPRARQTLLDAMELPLGLKARKFFLDEPMHSRATLVFEINPEKVNAAAYAEFQDVLLLMRKTGKIRAGLEGKGLVVKGEAVDWVITSDQATLFHLAVTARKSFLAKAIYLHGEGVDRLSEPREGGSDDLPFPKADSREGAMVLLPSSFKKFQNILGAGVPELLVTSKMNQMIELELDVIAHDSTDSFLRFSREMERIERIHSEHGFGMTIYGAKDPAVSNLIKYRIMGPADVLTEALNRAIPVSGSAIRVSIPVVEKPKKEKALIVDTAPRIQALYEKVKSPLLIEQVENSLDGESRADLFEVVLILKPSEMTEMERREAGDGKRGQDEAFRRAQARHLNDLHAFAATIAAPSKLIINEKYGMVTATVSAEKLLDLINIPVVDALVDWLNKPAFRK